MGRVIFGMGIWAAVMAVMLAADPLSVNAGQQLAVAVALLLLGGFGIGWELSQREGGKR